jgi:hypothetical protein
VLTLSRRYSRAFDMLTSPACDLPTKPSDALQLVAATSHRSPRTNDFYFDHSQSSHVPDCSGYHPLICGREALPLPVPLCSPLRVRAQDLGKNLESDVAERMSDLHLLVDLLHHHLCSHGPGPFTRSAFFPRLRRAPTLARPTSTQGS